MRMAVGGSDNGSVSFTRGKGDVHFEVGDGVTGNECDGKNKHLTGSAHDMKRGEDGSREATSKL